MVPRNVSGGCEVVEGGRGVISYCREKRHSNVRVDRSMA